MMRKNLFQYLKVICPLLSLNSFGRDVKKKAQTNAVKTQPAKPTNAVKQPTNPQTTLTIKDKKQANKVTFFYNGKLIPVIEIKTILGNIYKEGNKSLFDKQKKIMLDFLKDISDNLEDSDPRRDQIEKLIDNLNSENNDTMKAILEKDYSKEINDILNYQNNQFVMYALYFLLYYLNKHNKQNPNEETNYYIKSASDSISKFLKKQSEDSMNKMKKTQRKKNDDEDDEDDADTTNNKDQKNQRKLEVELYGTILQTFLFLLTIIQNKYIKDMENGKIENANNYIEFNNEKYGILDIVAYLLDAFQIEKKDDTKKNPDGNAKKNIDEKKAKESAENFQIIFQLLMFYFMSLEENIKNNKN